MPAALFENDLARGTMPARTGALTRTSGIGDAIRNLWPVCHAGEWLEGVAELGLESGRASSRIKQSENDQLRRNRQKLRDEPHGVKV